MILMVILLKFQIRFDLSILREVKTTRLEKKTFEKMLAENEMVSPKPPIGIKTQSRSTIKTFTPHEIILKSIRCIK